MRALTTTIDGTQFWVELNTDHVHADRITWRVVCRNEERFRPYDDQPGEWFVADIAVIDHIATGNVISAKEAVWGLAYDLGLRPGAIDFEPVSRWETPLPRFDRIPDCADCYHPHVGPCQDCGCPAPADEVIFRQRR